MDLKNIITQRKSVREFDETHRIPRDIILEAITLASKAPNANNVQSTRYLLIEDSTLRSLIQPIAYNQEQITTSSYLILILGDYTALREENIKQINNHSVELGVFDHSVNSKLTSAAINYYKDMDIYDQKKELVRDGSLAAMNLVLVLNDMGYQTITMSGYKKRELFNTLNIPETYEDIMLLSVGKAKQNGYLTIRHKTEKIVFVDQIRN